MLYRNGTAVSVLVEFLSGQPDGNVTWTLKNEAGATIDSGTVTPPPAAVSIFITVPANMNTLGVGELIGYRDLSWTYSSAGESISGDRRYVIEELPPFGASPEGVRLKLGVDVHELPDPEVSLARAYYNILTLAGDPDLLGFTPTSRERLYLADAIEAMAGLAIIPTLQLRLAVKESSGTDTFQRQKMDWELLAENLRSIVNDGVVVLDPAFDPLAEIGELFILATPATDPLTGDTAA